MFIITLKYLSIPLYLNYFYYLHPDNYLFLNYIIVSLLPVIYSHIVRQETQESRIRPYIEIMNRDYRSVHDVS